MGREVKRVPLDFDWPIREVWSGFLRPDSFDEVKCPDCKLGYSPGAQRLNDLWWGNLPFDPASTGSTPLRHDTPAVRAFAERNITSAPDFYGTGEHAVRREAQRLADLWNGMWMHHLTQDDVDALIADDRLRDFTHTRTPEHHWQKIDPPVTPTAAQVNEWSLHGWGHDSCNAGVVVRARCERDGIPEVCSSCDGHASTEAYPGQRAEAEVWESTPPPVGEDYWLYRVRVADGQAVVGFPKFSTVGIGFAVETDWNTNLPYTCDTVEIYEHIEHNRGDESIRREDCIEAIRMIQNAVQVAKTALAGGGDRD